MSQDEDAVWSVKCLSLGRLRFVETNLLVFNNFGLFALKATIKTSLWFHFRATRRKSTDCSPSCNTPVVSRSRQYLKLVRSRSRTPPCDAGFGQPIYDGDDGGPLLGWLRNPVGNLRRGPWVRTGFGWCFSWWILLAWIVQMQRCTVEALRTWTF